MPGDASLDHAAEEDELSLEVHRQALAACEVCDSRARFGWMANLYQALNDWPTYLPDLCPAISRPLVEMLLNRLPAFPALTVSVGCGSGLLEATLLCAGKSDGGNPANIIGVEVPDCVVTHLPHECIARVADTSTVYGDAMLASSVMFVYPRQSQLVVKYLDMTATGALAQLVWLGHRNDWPEMEPLLSAVFLDIEYIDGPGIAESEVLVVASTPRPRPAPLFTFTEVKPTLDLWEHAALLFHGYEWQAAADTFYLLANQLICAKQRTLCLLNAGLVQARLGDFANATAMLEEAVQVNGGFAITAFVVGHVSYEIQDVPKAEACFELCLEALKDHDIDHHGLGMAFVLSKEMVYWNLRAAREAQFRAKTTGSDLAVMYSIPTEYIFEAPSPIHRKQDQKILTRSASTSTAVRKEIAERLHKGVRWLRHSEDKTQTSDQQTPASTSSSLSVHSIQPGLPELVFSDSDSCYTPASPSPVTPISATTWPDNRITWHCRPRTPFIPRDARVALDSTRDLAHFIRTEGQRQGHPPKLQPRDPRGQHGPTDKLARFFCSAQEKDQVSLSGYPLRLGSDIIGGGNLSSTRVPAQTESSSGSGLLRGVSRQASAPVESETISPLALPSPEYLEILKPTVYVPPDGKVSSSDESACRRRPPPPQQCESNEDTTSVCSPQRAVPWTASSYSAEVKRERGKALRLLEGRGSRESVRSLSQTSSSSLKRILKPVRSVNTSQNHSSSSLPRTVASEDFFTRVLSKVKR